MKPIDLRPLYVLAALVLVMAALSEQASANEPPSITRHASSSTLTDAQRREVRNYVQYWCQQLEGGDSARIARARAQLIEPLRAPGLRLVFRDEYSRITVPELERILSANTPSVLSAINAVQVAGALGTEASLRLIVDRADSDRETRMPVRLWASHAFRLVLEEDAIQTARLTPFVRDFSRAAERETNWMVLNRQIEGLAKVRTSQSRERQIAVLHAATERAKANDGGPAQLMEPIRLGILMLRDQYLDLSGQEQTDFGKAIGRLLGQVIEIPPLHWNTAREHEEHHHVYRSALRMSESLLRIVDQRVRGGSPPPLGLENAWESGDREAYEGILTRWRQTLGAVAYQ